MRDWAHVISSLRGHWLPGDPRGFRDHGHRLHSSGDYRNPPPPGEHAGLHRYAMSVLGNVVRLKHDEKQLVAECLLNKLAQMRIPAAALSVDGVHCHALIRVGDADARDVFGRAKQFASHQLRSCIPGKMWGASSKVERIRDEGHFANTVCYIWDHRDEGAWAWCANEHLGLLDRATPE